VLILVALVPALHHSAATDVDGTGGGEAGMPNRDGEKYLAELNVPWVLLWGALGGVVAGLVFAAYEVAVAVAARQPPWQPAQLVAAMILGDNVLNGGVLSAPVIVVASLTHLVLSLTYGMILALLAAIGLAALPSLRAMVLLGLAWGLALWIMNFFVLAPLAFPWFDSASLVTQAIGHVFFYGGVLGLFLGWRFAGLTARRA
jgi:hypothetical protein